MLAAPDGTRRAAAGAWGPLSSWKETYAATLGIFAGLYDKTRNEEASKDLRDDYAAINHIIAGYTILLTAAYAFGDTKTAEVCKSNLKDHVLFVNDINAYMPALVLEEYAQDGGLSIAPGTLEGVQQMVHDIWQQPPHTDR